MDKSSPAEIKIHGLITRLDDPSVDVRHEVMQSLSAMGEPAIEPLIQVLEEAPDNEPSDAGQPFKLLTLSAKTNASLLRYIEKLRAFFNSAETVNLADVSYTLQTGRKAFVYRLPMVFENKEDLLSKLNNATIARQIIKSRDSSQEVVFMFPGQGSQYVGMCKDLYATNKVFSEQMDKGFLLLKQLTGKDFKAILYGSEESKLIHETRYTQPLLFLIEHSLARLLLWYGIEPRLMIGHSIGEYVAACIGGVFEFEAALGLVVKRAELMNDLPPGNMLSAAMAASSAKAYLNNHISLAAINGPGQVVFSGDGVSITGLQQQLEAAGIASVLLHTSHAFHSSMQEGILDAYQKEVEKLSLHKPSRAIISNVTGQLLTEGEAVSADYWVRHLRHTVQFGNGLETILSQPRSLVCIEVGAGQVLKGLLKQQPLGKTVVTCINLVRSAKEKTNDVEYITTRLGQLWSQGVAINWMNYYKGEQRRRVSLPTYSFEPVPFPTEVNPFAHITSSGQTPVKEETQNVKEEVIESIIKQERPLLETVFAPAITPTEIRLQAMFETFFSMEAVGVEDSFFDLGGDSLKGMVFLRRIKNEFNVHMTITDFFNKYTIRQIGAYIDEIKLLLQEKTTTTRKSVII